MSKENNITKPVDNSMSDAVAETNESEPVTRPPLNRTEVSDRNTRIGAVIAENNRFSGMENAPTAGDLETDAYQAQVVGEEAAGGTTPTPAQNNVDDLGADLGVELADSEAVQMTAKLERRDEERWQLDPASAEDR
ncbi:MAG: DUF6335 family protein [Jaaginema sp. PMC 1079.18]|nr:DUF6335 family protein [Jaaginema sp. PMC 1080.18]MEC4852226.1 DUF6335 family protein [Jaaginema sp. PMC 1079.18]MEC4866970.1 DUF6335 family protein [Jaaginema sp. PMC 1078.18]